MIPVAELIDREEIRQCVLRHFRAADRVDADLERAAFWDDGCFVGGPIDGKMSDIIPSLYGELLGQSFDVTCHYIANMMVTVAGNSGFVECYGVGYHLIADNPAALQGVLGEAKYAEIADRPGDRHELLVGVRYAVEMARRQGVWKIFKMQPIIDWTRVQPAAGIVDGGLPAAIAGRGQRSRSDASYFGGDWAP